MTIHDFGAILIAVPILVFIFSMVPLSIGMIIESAKRKDYVQLFFSIFAFFFILGILITVFT